MNTLHSRHFERAPHFHTDRRTKESLLKLVTTIGRLGKPSLEGDGYLEYWENVIAERGGKLDSRKQLKSAPSLDRRYEPPDRRQEGMVITSSFSILGEVVEFPPSSHSPIAVAHWRAELYGNPENRGESHAIVWGDYEISVAPAANTEDKGGIGLVVDVDITPRANEPYPLPTDISELWDELSLESMLPCPEQGPLFYTTRVAGRAQQLQGLAKLALGN